MEVDQYRLLRIEQDAKLNHTFDLNQSVVKLKEVITGPPERLHQSLHEIRNILATVTSDFPDLFAFAKSLFDSDEWSDSDINLQMVQREIDVAQCRLYREVYSASEMFTITQQVEEAERLEEVWNVIQQSNELANESKETIEELDSNIDKMKGLGSEIKRMIVRHKAELEENKRKSMLSTIRSLYNTLRDLFIESHYKISDLITRITLHKLDLDSWENKMNDVFHKNWIMASTGYFTAFDDTNKEKSGQNFANLQKNLQNMNEADRAMDAIKEQREVFAKLMKQIDDLEKRMQEIERIKEEAKDFLKNNGQLETEALKFLEMHTPKPGFEAKVNSFGIVSLTVFIIALILIFNKQRNV